MKQNILLSLLIILNIFLSGCAGLPKMQDWANVAYEKEDIVFLENKADARIKWKYKVDTPKIFTQQTKKYFRPSERPIGETYLIDSSPIVTTDEIFVQKDGKLLRLNSLTGEILDEYNIQDILKNGFVLDEFKNDPDGTVFSVLIDHGKQKYILVKNVSDIKTQRYGRPKAIGRFIDYYKGKLVSAILQYKTVSVIDAFRNKIIWTQPKQLLGWFCPVWTKNKYHKLFDIEFDKKNEIIITLHKSKKEHYLLNAYRFDDGSVVWEKEMISSYPDKFKESLGIIFIHQGNVVFMELDKSSSKSINRIFDIGTGKEIYHFEGVANLNFNNVDKAIYYLQDDIKNDRAKIFIYNYQNKQLKEIKIEEMDPLMGIIQVNNQLIYFTNKKMEWTYVDTGKDYKIRALGYDGIRAVDINTLEEIWDVQLGVQEFEPVIDEGVIYIGDPMGMGKISEIIGWSRKELPPEAIVIDTKSGKVLWKAKISNEGRITRMAVLGNMAFIKTLNGNLFAIEWEKSE